MMNKWAVDVTLKSRYAVLHCCYKGDEDDSTSVLQNIIPRNNNIKFIGLLDVFEEQQYAIAVDDISFVEVRPFNQEEKNDGCSK